MKAINALANRLGINPAPKVVWAGEARDVEKRLLENLRSRQQPSLFEEVG